MNADNPIDDLRFSQRGKSTPVNAARAGEFGVGNRAPNASKPTTAWNELSQLPELAEFRGRPFLTSAFVLRVNEIKSMLESRAGISRSEPYAATRPVGESLKRRSAQLTESCQVSRRTPPGARERSRIVNSALSDEAI
jgi:hypothetical protein